MAKTARGFSVIEVVVVALAILLIGFGGWYVWQRGHKGKSSASTSSNSNEKVDSPTVKATYKTPEGYVAYENQELGFKLAYPKEYGDIVRQPDVSGIQIFKSAEPTAEYGPGIAGVVRVSVYATADKAIGSRKYGPQIKLQDGKWIVTEANETDFVANKAGEQYKAQDRKIPPDQTNDGLTVYTLKSNDEGTEIDRLEFVINGKLNEIYLPSFSDMAYNTNTATDKTIYNELLNNIRDSVRAIN